MKECKPSSIMSDWLREVEHAGYSVQYAGPNSEESPLLPNQARDARCVRIFWILFLTILFCTGLSIGCYLIIEEDREYPVIEPYILMNRAGWRAQRPIETLPQFPSQLSHVAITQTTTDNCDNINDCSKIIRDLQHDHVTSKNLSDIAYNFIVAGDGATYEGRGWKFQPELPDVVRDRTLVIAFLGNFDDALPTNNQIIECRVLLREAVSRGFLNPCFTISLFKDRPQDGGGQLVHTFNRLAMENNKRKLSLDCSQKNP